VLNILHYSDYIVNQKRKKMIAREQIRAALIDRNLSHVAREIGVTRQTLYRFIRVGKCSVTTLEKLSEYLERKL
jgi:DNA-binding phage protein